MGDRYTILGAIAKGGMAQVYLARMVGSGGFSRLVAIKRLHDSLATDRDFVAMLLDEARVTAHIRHTNVVDTLDLVVRDGAFALVMEWVEGASLSALVKRAKRARSLVPQPIALAILQGVLRGLVAAHEARADDGQPLGIVHRDVSPQNVLVGVDGIPRLIDFGVAKAFGKLESTRPGEIRGKYGYMAPEQLMGRPVTRQVDVYAVGVIAWEMLTGERLFRAEDERVVCAAVLRGDIAKPSSRCEAVPAALDDVVLKATAREPSQRYFEARDMLAALEPFGRASEDAVGAWVRELAADAIAEQQKTIQQAQAPAPPRSLGDVLAELESSRPSSRSLSIDSVGALRATGPIADVVPSPRTRVFSSETGHFQLAAPTATSFALPIGIFVALAMIGIGLGAASFVKAGPPVHRAILPAPHVSVTVTSVPSASIEVVAPEPPATAPHPPKRPRTRTAPRDPTDHR